MHSLSNDQRKFTYLLLGTVFLHLCFLAMQIDKDSFRTPKFTTDEPMKVQFIPATAGKVATTSQNKQIVQSEDSDSSEKKDGAYLSDKDRSFDRQTVARNVDTFQKTALGDSTETKKAQKGEKAQTAKPSLKDIKLSDMGIEKADFTPREASRAPASESKKGMKNGDASSQGLSATNDYVQEVTLGDFTHMNTVEFKFYGFYHRIRQKLEQFWGKSIQEKSQQIFRSGRRIASQDYITSLQVTLNEKGEIVKVKILGASGVKELDDAAIESFNEAGPFPNPPKDLLVNGKAVIQWGFVVKS